MRDRFALDQSIHHPVTLYVESAMSQDSPQDQAFWTAERIERLEQALALWQQQDTVYA